MSAIAIDAMVETPCYSSTWTVYVDFVSRLLLRRVMCLLMFFMTAINMNVES
jgi:hypothetical protein